MANNPNCRDNLKPMKKGEKGRNPNGRPKKLVNLIKEIPPDCQTKVYGILYHALSLKDETEAKEYLEAQSGELGEYGFLMQIAVRRLTSMYGWDCVVDIMDRLFGKPRQEAEVTHKAEGMTILVNSTEEGEKLKSLGNLGI